MRWECTECGCRIERPRPPAVCRSCGTAGAIFVEADTGIEEDMEAETTARAGLILHRKPGGYGMANRPGGYQATLPARSRTRTVNQ